MKRSLVREKKILLIIYQSGVMKKWRKFKKKDSRGRGLNRGKLMIACKHSVAWSLCLKSMMSRPKTMHSFRDQGYNRPNFLSVFSLLCHASSIKRVFVFHCMSFTQHAHVLLLSLWSLFLFSCSSLLWCKSHEYFLKYRAHQVKIVCASVFNIASQWPLWFIAADV